MNFSKLSHKISDYIGKPIMFWFALGIIIGWFSTGPYFNWSNSHSLFINTVTTIITFLICFIIQSSQNKDTSSIMLKLDEIIRSIDTARNEFINIEDLSDKELKQKIENFKEDNK